MTEKLKPCPFCGGRATLFKNIDGTCYFVYCSKEENPDCFVNPDTIPFSTLEEARIAWNRRASDEQKPEG